MRIRVRLTLIFTAALAMIILVAGMALILTFRAQLRSTIDKGLLARAEVIAAANRNGDSLLAGSSLVKRDESFAQILTNGEVSEASRGLTRSPLISQGEIDLRGEPAFLTRDFDLGEEIVRIRLVAVALGGGDVLLVGSSLEEFQETVGVVTGMVAVGGPAVVALGAWLVWSVTGAALKPVERMRKEADAISMSEPGRRLSLPETGDEINRLGESLNQMLARLDQALARERSFVDEASHELRTPVAKLKSELELALAEATTSEQLKTALSMALADTDDLARLTQDLLVLARADRGRLPIRKEEVDLGDLMDQAAAGFSRRGEGKGVEIQIEANGTFSLDPLRLRQVLTNLLDNSLRHTPSGGSVRISAVEQNGSLALAVEDDGPGFTRQQLDSPFETFRRDETSGSDGAGLGLPIVRAIVEAHGGEARLENRTAGGARVMLTFPMPAN